MFTDDCLSPNSSFILGMSVIVVMFNVNQESSQMPCITMIQKSCKLMC